VEILTVHEVLGKRLIALPEECLPIAREVMLLPETTPEGPAWLLVSRDPQGQRWLAARLEAPQPEPTHYDAGKGTTLRLTSGDPPVE
jgi:hypothetical protein